MLWSIEGDGLNLRHQFKKSMINLTLIFSLIFLSALIYLIVLVFKNFVSRWNLKQALGVDFGFRFGGDHRAPRCTDYSYRYERSSGGKGPDIAHFILWMDTPCQSDEFIVVRERLFDKIFKALSISNEIQTGHHWFDKRYYIVSESHKTVQPLLELEPICHCIASVLSEGFDYIKFEEGVLKTGFNSFTGWRWFKSGVIERSAKQMTRLLEAMEVHHGIPKKRRKGEMEYNDDIEGYFQFYLRLPDKTLQGHPPKWVRQRKWWLLSAVYVAATGLFLSFTRIFFEPYVVISSEDLFNWSLIYVAFPLMVLHLFAAGTHLMGRSRSHKELSFMALCNGLGYSLVAIFVVQILNGFLDSSPVISHPSKLLATEHISSGKGPDPYYIIVESWIPASDTEKLEVSQSFHKYSVTRINHPIFIQTRAGFFDLEWLQGYGYESEAPRL
ncbi:MAG: hypothetical protein GXP14_15745 [Gammaproteobacteria bacterium]|nr:hypothetical protein [Gammaproteobacteria bacterium]